MLSGSRIRILGALSRNGSTAAEPYQFHLLCAVTAFTAEEALHSLPTFVPWQLSFATLTPSALHAHHTHLQRFDPAKEQVVTGTAERFAWQN